MKYVQRVNSSLAELLRYSELFYSSPRYGSSRCLRLIANSQYAQRMLFQYFSSIIALSLKTNTGYGYVSNTQNVNRGNTFGSGNRRNLRGYEGYRQYAHFLD